MQALSTYRVGHRATQRDNKRAGAPVDPWWIVAILKRGWRILLGATLGGLALGAVVAFFLPSTWESEAVIVPDVDPDPANPFASSDALNEGAELIEHPTVLASVRRRLGTGGTIEDLERRIDAEAERELGAIRLRTRSGSRAGAAALGNVVIDAFMTQRRESEAERLRERARVRRDELAAAERSLAEARGEYDRFRAEHGITDLEEEREHAIQEVARLSAEADEASVAAITSAARMEILRREARRLPRMQTQSAQRTDLVRGQLAEARAELATARARYTADHPAVQTLEARIESLEREQRSPTAGGAVAVDATMGVNTVREQLEGSAALAVADRATAAEQEVGLRRLVEMARERVRALSQIEGQASLLLAAVRVGEQQVETIRRDITESEDRMGNPPAGFHVSAPPAAPEASMPSKEKKLALVVPPLLAFLVAFGVLFFRERGGPRARTAAEIAWWGQAPVIGTTTWPRDPEALELLVAELEDLGSYAAGRTLVVPATEDEKDLAVELADKISDAPWLASAIDDGEGIPLTRRLPTSIDLTPSEPVHRPTLPMPAVVTPAPDEVDERVAAGELGDDAIGEDAAGEDAAGEDAVGEDARAAEGVHRGTVRTVIEGDEVVGERVTDVAEVADDELAPMAATGSDDRAPLIGVDEARPRRITGRFALGSPTVLVGGDVRASNIVPVGGSEGGASVSASAAMMSPPPEGAETRTVQVSGTVDVDGTGRQTPFVVHAEAPKKQDSVLMLAMRILGDGRAERASVPAQVLESRPAPHRPEDPSESRAPVEEASALAWTGKLEGPALRRAARLADRVIVMVREGSLSPADLAKLQTKLGREDGIGLLVVGVDDDQANRKDRLGDVAEFWTARKRLPG